MPTEDFFFLLELFAFFALFFVKASRLLVEPQSVSSQALEKAARRMQRRARSGACFVRACLDQGHFLSCLVCQDHALEMTKMRCLISSCACCLLMIPIVL
ncbi:hypothetical protein V8C44DRAFT_318154 [Trichoderma aethiopicum]